MEKVENNKNMDQYNLNYNDFEKYLNSIIHEWSKVLTTLAFTLVPIFFLLDFFMMPNELIPRFGVYRLISTIIALIQYFILRKTKPSKSSYYHGYFVSINVGGIIALMTVDLGGFNSSYYAGLNLVIIGVNLLLPWRTVHSVANSLIVIVMYLFFNIMAGSEYVLSIMTNNLFFLASTAVIAVSINHVKHRLVKKEFSLLVELKNARDALWSEIELAKRIQTAILPEKNRIRGYEVASVMLPAQEVGGDYYDIIETASGKKWVTMGDVSGHGVDSGLIMMMAQTSMTTMVNNASNCRPSEILESVNKIIRENISRLGSDHYMTMLAIQLNEFRINIAGKHQDVIIYRCQSNQTEIIPTKGTWLGISENIGKYLEDITVEIEDGDLILLFTDGITEAMDETGEMYGQHRLEHALHHYADLPVKKIIENIVKDVLEFQSEQLDDMTLVIIKKTQLMDG